MATPLYRTFPYLMQLSLTLDAHATIGAIALLSQGPLVVPYGARILSSHSHILHSFLPSEPS